jgi:hypothetical protein
MLRASDSRDLVRSDPPAKSFLVTLAVLVCTCAALGAAGGVQLHTALSSDHGRAALDPHGWVSPVPVDVRALRVAAVEPVGASTCRVFDDPTPGGWPLADPTLYKSLPLSAPEPSVLVCGAQTVVLPSVAYDRSVWVRQGGAEADFRAPLPWCEWAPPESTVLACWGQGSVRVPAGALDLVTATLDADMADRRAAWSR